MENRFRRRQKISRRGIRLGGSQVESVRDRGFFSSHPPLLFFAFSYHWPELGVALGLAGRTDHYPDYWPELGVVLGLAGRTDHHLDY